MTEGDNQNISVVYWDVEDPMKPVGGESSAANRALIDYARMGYSRSLRKLCEEYSGMEDPPTKALSTLFEWSKSLAWQDRVERWEDIERKREEKVWRDRRDNLRKREWDNFERLQEIVSGVLDDIPSFIRRREKVIQEGTPKVVGPNMVISEGTPEVRVITLQMDVNAAIKFIRTASDIGRRAAEMNQDHMAKVLKELDFEKLEPDQVSRLAAGDHILDVLGVRK